MDFVYFMVLLFFGYLVCYTQFNVSNIMFQEELVHLKKRQARHTNIYISYKIFTHQSTRHALAGVIENALHPLTS